MTDHNLYFDYLKQRSYIAFLYRKFWLYPRLNQFLQGRTLDVGCGIGDLLACRKNTIGVDINKKMVDWCLSQGYSAELMQADKLPYFDGSYDSVIIDNVLEHIIEPQAILNEVRRVLVDNGVLIVGVPGSLGYSRDPDHKVFYSKNKLIETLNKVGFSEKKVFAMPFNIMWLDTRLSQYCIYAVFLKT
jgi:SAM-dependent methyltransferase